MIQNVICYSSPIKERLQQMYFKYNKESLLYNKKPGSRTDPGKRKVMKCLPD